MTDQIDPAGRTREAEQADRSDRPGQHQPSIDPNDLTGRDLSNADLRNVEGLLPEDLARANLAGAQLPPDFEFGGVDHANQIAQAARPVYLAMILTCAYTALTVAGTTDSQLLSDSLSTALPVLDFKVPLSGFFILAPTVLLATYLYLHSYLQRLWEEIAKLPTVFPDGRTIESHLHPWLLSRFSQLHRKATDKRVGLYQRIETLIAAFLAWGLVPLTLWFFWLRYLAKHEWIGTGIQIAVFVIAVGLGMYFQQLATATLRAERLHGRVAGLIGGVLVAFTLALSSAAYYALEDGTERYACRDLRVASSSLPLWKRAIAFARSFTYADLSRLSVSQRPTNYWLISEADRLVSLSTQSLQGQNLRHLEAIRTFFAGSDFSNADLTMSCMVGADLQGARFQKTIFSATNLTGADLRTANLERAIFVGAKTNFTEANLQGAKLGELDASGPVDFSSADLSDAVLNHAELTNPRFDNAILRGAKLRQILVAGGSFRGADLSQADLTWARFEDVDMRDAILAGARLGGAVLTTAKLEMEQLEEACGDESTKLPFAYTLRPCPE
jgi:uncharacterized protein YjbI with pentapeptide repeats